MIISEEQLKGWTVIKANTVAAASYYVSKEASRPTLGTICIEVDDEGTTATATDARRLGHFKSMDAPKLEKNEHGKFLLKWADIKAAKLISASPKKTLWLAVRRTEDEFKRNMLELMTLNWTGYVYEKVGQLTINDYEGNFPMWRKLDQHKTYIDSRKSTVNKDKVNDNESPGFNTSYMIDIFQSVAKAVSDCGDTTSQILHRGMREPIYIIAHNASDETALVLLMPVVL